MTSIAGSRDLPPFHKWLMITFSIIIGGGYAFGPPSFTAADHFVYIRSIEWFPPPVWGFAFMLSGILMIRSKLLGYALAAVLWSTWELAIIAAIDRIEAWGAVVWPLFFVAMCSYEVYRWSEHKLVLVRERQISSLGELWTTLRDQAGR